MAKSIVKFDIHFGHRPPWLKSILKYFLATDAVAESIVKFDVLLATDAVAKSIVKFHILLATVLRG